MVTDTLGNEMPVEDLPGPAKAKRPIWQKAAWVVGGLFVLGVIAQATEKKPSAEEAVVLANDSCDLFMDALKLLRSPEDNGVQVARRTLNEALDVAKRAAEGDSQYQPLVEAYRDFFDAEVGDTMGPMFRLAAACGDVR